MSIFSTMAFVLVLNPMQAQESDQQAVAQQIRQLTDSMTRAQAQLDEAQRQISVMKEQLAALEGRTKARAHVRIRARLHSPRPLRRTQRLRLRTRSVISVTARQWRQRKSRR